jgi:hypothetical protein
MISEPMVRSAHIVHHLASRLMVPPYGPKWDFTWPMSHRSTIGCVKMISYPMVRSAQTMQLSCVKINYISKWTKMSFHLTNVTLKYHRVCLKRFPCLWYIQHKPYTYLVSSLTLCPNGPKRASTWPRHLEVASGVPNDFHAYGTFSTNRAPIKHKTNTISKRTETSFHLTYIT